MSEGQGYDDMFNDGLFRSSFRASHLRRPNMWPKSVSEMRVYTSYGGQGMSLGHDTGHSTFMLHRPYARAPHSFGWAWADRRG
jgi:hypothetical protein